MPFSVVPTHPGLAALSEGRPVGPWAVTSLCAACVRAVLWARTRGTFWREGGRGFPKEALSSFEPATWLGTCQVKPSACHEPCVVLAFLARVEDQCFLDRVVLRPITTSLLLHLPPSALRTIEIPPSQTPRAVLVFGDRHPARKCGAKQASSSFPIGETLDLPARTVPVPYPSCALAVAPRPFKVRIASQSPSIPITAPSHQIPQCDY